MDDALVEALLNDGKLTAAHLAAARELQRVGGGSLVARLIELGHVRRGDVLVAASRALRLPPAPPSRVVHPDPALADEFPRPTLDELCAVPFMRRQGALCLAVADALSIERARAARSKSGSRVELFAATELDVRRGIDALCGPEPAEPGPFEAVSELLTDQPPVTAPPGPVDSAPSPAAEVDAGFDPFGDAAAAEPALESGAAPLTDLVGDAAAEPASPQPPNPPGPSGAPSEAAANDFDDEHEAAPDAATVLVARPRLSDILRAGEPAPVPAGIPAEAELVQPDPGPDALPEPGEIDQAAAEPLREVTVGTADEPDRPREVEATWPDDGRVAGHPPPVEGEVTVEWHGEPGSAAAPDGVPAFPSEVTVGWPAPASSSGPTEVGSGGAPQPESSPVASPQGSSEFGIPTVADPGRPPQGPSGAPTDGDPFGDLDFGGGPAEAAAAPEGSDEFAPTTAPSPQGPTEVGPSGAPTDGDPFGDLDFGGGPAEAAASPQGSAAGVAPAAAGSLDLGVAPASSPEAAPDDAPPLPPESGDASAPAPGPSQANAFEAPFTAMEASGGADFGPAPGAPAIDAAGGFDEGIPEAEVLPDAGELVSPPQEVSLTSAFWSDETTVHKVSRVAVDGSRVTTEPVVPMPPDPVTAVFDLRAHAEARAASPRPLVDRSLGPAAEPATTDEFAIDIAETPEARAPDGLPPPGAGAAGSGALDAYAAQLQEDIERARDTGFDREQTSVYNLADMAKSEAAAAAADLEVEVRRRLEQAQNEGDVTQVLMHYFGQVYGRSILLERNGDRLIGIQGRRLAWPALRFHELDLPADAFPPTTVDWMPVPQRPETAKLVQAVGDAAGLIVVTIVPRKGKTWVVCAEAQRPSAAPRELVQLSARAAEALSRVRF